MGVKEGLVKKLSLKTKVDPRVVRLIADFPIKFAKEKMSNDETWRPIRIRYFCMFTPKNNPNEFTSREKRVDT